MKVLMCILSWLFIIITSIHGQDKGMLNLEVDRLSGDCESPIFTGFTIELDSTYDRLDSTILFSQLPRIGSINFKNRVNIPTEFTLTERAGYPQIMFRFRSSYYAFDNLEIKENGILFDFYLDPDVPATEEDLKIVRIAKGILSQKERWHKEDDRSCEDDMSTQKYSLYCALRSASLEVEEKYNHRNASLQKLRHLIDLKYPGRKWNHRLMDYNNMDETSFEDITNMLSDIELAFEKELQMKRDR